MTDSLTNNIKHLFKALAAQGVTDYVISPGSRTTPIALLLAEYATYTESINVYVDVDERSAAFFALGIAKVTVHPVVLIATSGTAIANWMPAVVEAQISNVPLILLSTDRPAELQHIGTQQTIDQTKLFGTQVKRFVAITLQDAHPDVTAYIDYEVQEIVRLAAATPAGPVHLNLPLRKPLMPVLGEPWPDVAAQTNVAAIEQIDLTALTAMITDKKVVILAGPLQKTVDVKLLQELAATKRFPIIADVLANVRGVAGVVNGIELLLQTEVIDDTLVPDIVIRLGSTPVSARVMTWVQDHTVAQIVVGKATVGKDYKRQISRQLHVDENVFLQALLASDVRANQEYLAEFSVLGQQVTKLMSSADHLNEITTAYAMRKAVPNSAIFVANSMPIRDMDNFFVPDHAVTVMANRGANGIDGTESTALGVATQFDQTYLITGGLTFFHDMNGLMMAKQYQLNLTVVVVNNDGGSIFSFLPQANAKDYFEEMFGTPLGLNVEKVANLYDATYHHPHTVQALEALIMQPMPGLNIIEITSDRAQNVLDHRQIQNELQALYND